MLLITPQAMAVDISVDGDIDDWGLSKLKSDDWSNPSTWIPTKDGISFFVEDNQDPYNTGAINYNDSYTGVHIYGNKTWQNIYREPLLVGNRTEPYGGKDGKFGEMYDIEAMYITENNSYVFVLIIFSTGMRDDKPIYLADLAMDFTPGGGYGYEYGVNLYRDGNENGDKYGIYYISSDSGWSVPTSFQENKPAEIVDFSDKRGEAIVEYGVLNKYDFGENNWVVEIAIPKAVIGNPDLPDDPEQVIKKFWISEECGNDAGPSIPEFITILIPVGLIVGTLYFLRRK